MELVYQWLERERRRQEKFASLYDMIFEGMKSHYLTFRISLFSLQFLFHFFFHCLTFYYMYHRLETRTFTFFILASAIKLAVTSGWWGGLEILRTGVRSAFHSNQIEVANHLIGFWQKFSFAVALPFLGISFYFLGDTYNRFLHGREILSSLFIALIFLSLVFQIPLGAYHSGIYGISRIMRPRISVVLSPIIGLLVFLLAWTPFGYYAVLLSFSAEVIVSMLLTYFYTRFMYQFYQLRPAFEAGSQFRHQLLHFPFRKFILAALANIFISADALLLIVFYFFSMGNPKALLYLEILFLVAPLIHAASDWARLFYFDRKQLENEQLSIFIAQYEKAVVQLALVLGGFFALFCSGACFLLLSDQAFVTSLLLIPFFLIRALIANIQVRAFSYYYFLDVIFSGILLTAILVLVALSPFSLPIKAALLSIGMMAIQGFFRRYRSYPVFKNVYSNLYTNLYDWLGKLSLTKGPLTLFCLEIAPSASPSQITQLIFSARNLFSLQGDQICRLATDEVYFYSCEMTTQPEALELLIIEGKGTILNIDSDKIQQPSSPYNSRTGYLLRVSPLLRKITDPWLKGFCDRPGFSTKAEDVVTHFFELFQKGLCYCPEKIAREEATPPPLSLIRKFNQMIRSYLFKRGSAKLLGFDLSLLFLSGKVEAIFLVPEELLNKEQLKEWHSYIHAVNVANSLSA